MSENEMRKLQVGDIVRGKLTGMVFVVTANYGNRVTAVRTVDITNPDEWEALSVQHNYEDEETDA